MVNRLQLTLPANGNKLLEETVGRLTLGEWYKNALDWTQDRFEDNEIEVRIKIVANAGLKITRLVTKHSLEIRTQAILNKNYEHTELVVVLASIIAGFGRSVPGWEAALVKEVTSGCFFDVCECVTSVVGDKKSELIEAEIVRLASRVDPRIINSKYGVNGIGSVTRINIQKGEMPVELHIQATDRVGVLQGENLVRDTLVATRLGRETKVKVFYGNEKVLI